jgi:hypothetical protein
VYLCVCGEYMCVYVYVVLHVCLCVCGEYICTYVYVVGTCVSMCMW